MTMAMDDKIVEPGFFQQTSSEATSHPIASPSANTQIHIRRAKPMTTKVFDSYWKFASERHQIYLHRVRHESGPWTKDPILREYKFTNTFRASDRVSQYLIRNVIKVDAQDACDTFFRILLFKFFNKIETWELFESTIGNISLHSFRFDQYAKVLDKALEYGARIYSAAYIMPSGPAAIRQPRKHRMHLRVLEQLQKCGGFERLTRAKNMADGYSLLREIPGIGPFLAYQFITDFNYSPHTDFSEVEFVVPGPGAKDGLKKCFSSLGDLSEADAIKWVSDCQAEEFAKRGLTPASLWGRPMQLIDCQNVFCEVDKYARVAHPEIAGLSGRVRIKQKFSYSGGLPEPLFPPKWGINEQIDLIPNQKEIGRTRKHRAKENSQYPPLAAD